MSSWRTRPWRRAARAPVAATAPWDYSQRPAEGEAVPNEPTPVGRRMGVALAQLADIAEAEQRERFPDMMPRCTDCAARAGTPPNGCLETLFDLVKCAIEGRGFYCHKGTDDGAKPVRRLCAGWMVLAAEGPHRKVLLESIR